MKLTYVNEIKYLMYFIYIFHMPCFIFVSGYLAKRMNEGGKLRADKILAIFWMYLLFKFGNVLIGYIFGQEVKLDLFRDQSAPWYLFALGIWYLLIPFLERIKTSYLIAGTFLLGLFAGYINSINSIMSLSKVIVFLPFFVLGFCTSGKLDIFLNKKLRLQALILLIAVLSGVAIFWEHIKPFTNILYGGSPYRDALGKLAAYGLPVRGIWYLLAIAVSGAFMLLIPRCKMFFSVFGERTMQIYMTHIWVRNALVYAGFFAFLKESPRCLTAIALLGSIILTFLLANRWLKRLFDLLMASKLFAKLLN
jgi:fucose 4-O-acetylase-like acetyltransferase